MKKLYTLTLLMFVSISGMAYAMEQGIPEGKQEEKVIPFEEIRLLSFLDPLPDEIKLPILSYVINVDTMDEAYKNIYSLSMTNKQAAALFKDDVFIKSFVDFLYNKFITPLDKLSNGALNKSLDELRSKLSGEFFADRAIDKLMIAKEREANNDFKKAIDLAITLIASLKNNTYAKDRLNEMLKKSPPHMGNVIIKPLMLEAIDNNSRKKFAVLKEIAPLVDFDNSFERDVLVYAAQENNEDMVKYLINDLNVDAQHALSYVLQWAHNEPNFSIDIMKKVVDLLLKYGVDINAKDSRGRTPLAQFVTHYKMSSVDDKSIDALKEKIDYLLSKGADINAVDDEGNSVLMVVVDRNRFELIKFLIERGADTKIINKKGKNVWDIAAEDDLFSEDLIGDLEEATGEKFKKVKIKKDE